jgi:hypothetical protein
MVVGSASEQGRRGCWFVKTRRLLDACQQQPTCIAVAWSRKPRGWADYWLRFHRLGLPMSRSIQDPGRGQSADRIETTELYLRVAAIVLMMSDAVAASELRGGA